MKLAQIVLDDATPRQRRLQGLDRTFLASRLEIVSIPLGGRRVGATLRDALASSEADVAHVYGPPVLPSPLLSAIEIPVVASGPVHRSPFPWRKTRQPDAILGSSSATRVPLAVDPAYFGVSSGAMPTSFRIGCNAPSRAGRALAVGTRHRIERFRDDIRWMFFSGLPSPAEMSLLNVWVDAEPAGDGEETGVPEALAAGRCVVAPATAANRKTLEEGAAGFLVPSEDPNETAHAVLAALFKPELRDPRIARGKQKAHEWRPERRAERLLEIYAVLMS